MKSTIITTAIAALFCTSTINASAQLGAAKKAMPVVITLGVKAGVNMQSTNGPTVDKSMATGIVGGAFVCVSRKKMGIRVEGLVKSAKIDFTTSTGTPVTFKTLALDVPVLFEYAPIKRLKLQAGPQFTTMLTAKDKSGVDVKDKLQSADIGIAAGVEINLPMKFIVGARYIKGFVDQNHTGTTDKWTTSHIQLSVGYRFLN